MLISAANNLCNHRQEVDNMNVFPVPDGDTGSNMSMTITACVKGLEGYRSHSLEDVSKNVANAALRGARGNSGVILSQLIRGVQKALVGVDEIDCGVLASCFIGAQKSAYKAVMKPTEGTILTVARIMGETAENDADKFDDIVSFFEHITVAGNEALANTPKMLPQLKQAGVVDSGGQGLMYLVEGALDYLKTGNIIENEQQDSQVQTETNAVSAVEDDIKFAYCTECIIEKKTKSDTALIFKSVIEKIGDSMVVVDDDEIVKVHIHTNQPDIVLAEALKLGDLSSVKIENMKIQHSNMSKIGDTMSVNDNKPVETDEQKKRIAFVAVSAGSGIAETFSSLGVDKVIEGGQTMNPSTEDIVDAVNSIHADNVFVFPNNKNIIMAAQQAKDICDANVVVIPTTSITQAISCLLCFDECLSVEQLEQEMLSNMKNGVSAQITYAVRDTVIDDRAITNGDILGIVEGKIKYIEKTDKDCLFAILDGYVDDDTDIVTVFYGAEVSEDEADEIQEQLEDKYPDTDFSFNYGGQPVYSYILSVE